jgi:hypothetical protein
LDAETSIMRPSSLHPVERGYASFGRAPRSDALAFSPE